MRTGVTDSSIARRWNRSTYWLNSFGIVFCVFGLVALTTFGVWNLERKGESNMATTPKGPSKDEKHQPITPTRDRSGEFSEERIPAKQKIEKAAPSEDIAGPFNKDKTKK
jgi:hypothetical protein